MEGDYQTCSWSKVYPKYHNSSPNNFFNSSLLKNILSDMANGIFSSDVQDMCTIIIKLENLNLINDQLFVESKIQSLQYHAKSKNYIKQYLLKKGIRKELIEEQISLFYQNYLV